LLIKVLKVKRVVKIVKNPGYTSHCISKITNEPANRSIQIYGEAAIADEWADFVCQEAGRSLSLKNEGFVAAQRPFIYTFGVYVYCVFGFEGVALALHI
jgi:hypothetical protein